MRFRGIITSVVMAGLFAAGLLSGCQETGPSRGFALPAGDPAAGQQAFVDLKCYTCHEVEGLEDELPRPTATPVVGVTLGGVASREPMDGELLTSILNPSHEIYPAGVEEEITSGGESRMANYNDVITAQQLIDLVAFFHERYVTVEDKEQ